jgi:hypothetical protein
MTMLQHKSESGCVGAGVWVRVCGCGCVGAGVWVRVCGCGCVGAVGLEGGDYRERV